MTDELRQQLKSQNYKRGVLKTQITLFDKFIADFDDNDQLSSKNVIIIKKRLDRFEPIIDNFNDIQSQIDCLLEELNDVDEINKAQTEREQFENNYYDLIGKATEFIQMHETSQCQNVLNSQVSNSPINVKLPTINLPIFDGAFSHWREFKDSFQVLIHANNDISEVQKLAYLKASVKGEPAGLLGSLETTAMNYEIAWNLLTKRYDNKRRIVNTHVQAILEVSPMSRENTSLRNLISTVENNMQCLKSLGENVDSWNALIVPIIITKLDFNTNKEWQSKINDVGDNDKIPTLNELLEFLTIKQSTMETIIRRKPEEKGCVRKSFAVTNVKCTYCQRDTHYISNCEYFKNLSELERNNKVKENKLCLNCLRKGHFLQDCKSKSKCKVCGKKHHSLLHKTRTDSLQSKEDNGDKSAWATVNCASQEHADVLLSTAIVHAEGVQTSKEIRVLLDSASQSNFITEDICNILKLKKEKININISGINSGITQVTHKCNIRIKSLHNNYSVTVTCLILPNITDQIPIKTFNKNALQIPTKIRLADPNFNKTANIDMLIGASLFYQLLCVGQIKERYEPIWQKTKFGWVVSGAIYNNNKPLKNISCLSLKQLSEQVERFWSDEEFLTKKVPLSEEEKFCENFFKETTKRDPETGRFIVKLPFKENQKGQIGNSRNIAETRYFKLERQLSNNKDHKRLYSNFMREYIELGHMTQIAEDNKPAFFMPHHGVINEASESTKLRVVFDGSCQPEVGLSVNEAQCTGPTIQEDLFSILARFRIHKYVLTGDIKKMYRQILVSPDDRQFQRIIWKQNPKKNHQIFELNTVTYGTTAAPYLAIRCLYQLGVESEKKYPKESQIIKKDFYVDDVLTGAETLEELRTIKGRLTNILKEGCFPLTKWRSNCPELMHNKVNDNIEINQQIYKTLGVFWNPVTDHFIYNSDKLPMQSKVTKRTILATTASLFDPLGLLAPVTIIAKLILQQLWQERLGWDESIPLNLQTTWQEYKGELCYVNQLEIPRRVVNNINQIELHTFCDASEKGYGASIYLRSIEGMNIKTSLLAAKSRVAPLKTISLPRLELNAALTGARLASKFKESLGINFTREFYWSDSQVALSWIHGSPNRWKTYVANRVSEITDLTNSKNWFHVKSEDNPADIISRGMSPKDLLRSQLWWHGPTWLGMMKKDWPKCNVIHSNESTDELRKVQTLMVKIDITFINNYSDINKLKRITAYCLRFKTNCQQKNIKQTGNLTVKELNNALIQIIKVVQNQCFAYELKDLRAGNALNSKSKILSLTPFIGEDGILRVGGRLKYSEFTYNKKHPILLPNKHHFTYLIMRDMHISLLHVGPNQLLSNTRENYWPINGKNLARKITRECITCIRYTKAKNPIMGNLPKERTKIMYPFFVTGVDYAGPYAIKDRKGRGCKITKAYLALFVCFSTKAVHLEIVSELSTKAFLATLRRFIARRGKPSKILSDNGTNFVGAKTELQKFKNFFKDNYKDVQNITNQFDIEWQFIPPLTPNFGGLWEAGVKSAKHHLRRLITNVPLTYEELTTLTTQVESLLNSRPLTQLSSDPNDLHVLTPAHFLIGRTFLTAADQDVYDIPASRLDRFEFMQKLTQQFWKKWSIEYIHEMQNRQKWVTNQDSIQCGNIVLLREDNLPPAVWKLGRIVKIHPGKDGVVRVVTIKTANATMKRPVSRLCVLPVDKDNKD